MSVQPQSTVQNVPAPGSRAVLGARRGFRLVAVLLLSLGLASAWLVFPYFFDGRYVLEDVGDQVVSERDESHRSLGQLLSRYAFGPGETEVDVLYATQTYFDRTSTPRARASYGPDDYHIFIVSESTHIDEVPQSLLRAVLRVDGAEYAAVDIEGPVDTDHHRSTVVRFGRTHATGAPIVTGATRKLELVMNNGWDPANTPRIAAWDLPISYPDAGNALASPALIMALSAGLLSATLTPCLIQLLVVYMATLTGFGAEQLGRDGNVPAVVRRKMFLIAVAFVVGFTLFYTAAGALIGYAGKAAAVAFDSFNRELAVGSGILVIAMGLWMGISSRAPLVCRIPAPKMMRGLGSGSYVRAALMAAGFSLGCMVCFSGAIMMTMFIYVGALGSASIGALVLFVFSLGVAIPFLAAAVFLSRTLSVMQWVSRYTPLIGLVSMIVIVGFGIVLITDNFHTLSDAIYPWLGLD
jgi:cytochrome c-type biogenesis protein